MKKPPTTLFSPRLFATILALLATALPVALSAAIPQRWTVETSRIQPARFEGYHGETIEFAATMQTYGKPLALPPTTNHEPPTTNHEISIYWQTNGMGSAYWTAPAEIRFEPAPTTNHEPPTTNHQPPTTNLVFFARWTPEMDVGANVYSCFIGAPGENYRAAFQLRLRPSPGAVPSELPLPVKTLDFAQVTVLNAPYYSKSETDAALSDKQDVVSDLATIRSGAALGATAVQPAAISDMATKSNLAGKIDVEYSPYESSTNRFEWTEAGFKVTAGRWGHLNYHEEEGVHIQFEDTFLTLLPQDAGQIVWRYPRGNKGGCLSLPSKNGVLATTSDLPTDSTISGWGFLKSYSETDPTVPSWAKATSKPSYTWSEIGSKPTFAAVATSGNYNDLSNKPTIPAVINPAVAATRGSAADAKDTKDALAALSDNVSTWSSFWSGDDVRVTVTNYDSAVNLPSLYLEYKLSNGLFRTVWDERTRWNTNELRMAALQSAVEGKADRAWGYYDSHTGGWAPDGYTWLSSPKIAISGGLAYQKHVTSEGAVWVLESNGLIAESGGVMSNGFFRISDDEGNPLFEIVKGDKRTVGATAGSCEPLAGYAITHLQIGYAVESADHPKIYVTRSLTPVDWKDEEDADCPATVSWSGSSGNWTAVVAGKVAEARLFVKAEYEVGGNTYIKQSAPVSVQKLVLGGNEYRVGTATISGHTVLTLTLEP